MFGVVSLVKWKNNSFYSYIFLHVEGQLLCIYMSLGYFQQGVTSLQLHPAGRKLQCCKWD